MTARYIIVSGGDQERRSRIARRFAAVMGFTAEPVGSGIAVTGPAMRLSSNGPLVIGQMFDSANQVEFGCFAGGAGEAVADEVVRRFWGRYIVLWPAGPDRLCVLREPMGALPCYYRSIDGLTLVASDLELIEAAVDAPRVLRWPEIARILGAGDLRSPETGITDVHELPAGHVLTIDRDHTAVRQVWDPWRHVQAKSEASFEEQANVLRTLIEMVISALGRAHPTAIATISGGLDSSIVALSLNGIVDSLTCVTAATLDPSGDERDYARIVADAAQAFLRERLLDTNAVDLSRSQVEHLPRPTGRPFFQAVSTFVSEVASETGASAVFNGTGGDNVFCFLQSVTPVLDQLCVGSPLGAIRTAIDVADLTNASYADVCLATAKRLLPGSHTYQWRTKRRFLTPCQEEEASAFAHPWLRPSVAARPGQLAHLAMLLRVQKYLEPWHPGDAFDVINPLLAQPIVEHCLSIPSWQWCRGGVDRAVARAAFADVLPPAVVQRTWKGGPDSFISMLIERNRSVLRTRLIEGNLASRGWLDIAAITNVLDDPRPPGAGEALRLLALSDAEAWIERYR